MDVFSEVNGWTADEFLRQFGLAEAADGKSYVCPVCDNGAKGNPRHGHGDGIKPRDSNGQTRWHCFKCGKDFSNFDLAAVLLGYDAEREPAEAAKVLKERLGYVNDKPATIWTTPDGKVHVNLTAAGWDEVKAQKPGDNNFPFSKADESARAASSSADKGRVSDVSEKNTASAKEPKNYSRLYRYCRANYDLKAFVDSQGGTWRGFTYETLSAAGAVYHAEYMVGEGEKAPVVILPYDDELYFWREVNGGRRGVPQGSKRKLYVAAPISTTAVNFMTEAELDALSVVASEFSGKIGGGVVATGSASFVRKTIEQLEAQFGNVVQKPKFVVVFDNDEAGSKHALEMVNALKGAGYPAELFFLEGEMAGEHEIHKSDGTIERYTVAKVDANDLLQRGDNELFRRLLEAYDGLYSKLQAQAAQMAADKEREQQAAANKSGMKLSSFTGYFASKFFADMERLARYSGRKTGFANIDAAQVFMPGLYVIGALPATGKTTFVWQLVNQLAAAGEPCVYCSFEMSEAELFSKSVARELFERKQASYPVMALTSTDIRCGAGLNNVDVSEVATKFTKAAVNLQVAEISNMGVVELIEALKPLAAATDKSLVVVIDYLQIMPSRDAKDTKAKIDEAVLRLKEFQRATNSTVIVISSFNRENYRRPVSFEAFKESGAIEYSADCVWGLENYGVDGEGKYSADEAAKESRNSVRKVKFTCLKNRNGGQYDCYFKYHAAHDCFEPLEKEKQDYPDDEE